MPFCFEVIQDLSLLVVRARGGLASADVARLRSDIATHPHYAPGFRRLADMRDSCFSPGADAIRAFARETLFRDGPAVVLVSHDLPFGLARMFGAHLKRETEPEFLVTRTVSEASDWLGVPEKRLAAILLALDDRCG